MFKKILKCQRGNLIVELAIIGPIVVAMLFGMSNFFLLLDEKLTCESLARDIARDAAIFKNQYDTEASAEELIRLSGLNVGRVDYKITPGAGTYEAVVEYESKALTPGVGGILPGGKPWKSTVTHNARAVYASEYGDIEKR